MAVLTFYVNDQQLAAQEGQTLLSAGAMRPSPFPPCAISTGFLTSAPAVCAWLRLPAARSSWPRA